LRALWQGGGLFHHVPQCSIPIDSFPETVFKFRNKNI
jgi:hypothetical protein